MMRISSYLTIVAFTIISIVSAHYANMGLEGVGCFIYDGMKDTTPGHMIVRTNNGSWHDHNEPTNNGSVTHILDQAAYDDLLIKKNKTK